MAHTHPVVDSDSRFVINSTTRAISSSSTEGSSKKFKITVDDAGTISATEVAQ